MDCNPAVNSFLPTRAQFWLNGTLTGGARRRQWHPTPVLLPGKSHQWRSLVGCSPWGREESDTTEQLHFHFSLSCIGEGNGNPLQCSYLENPRDRGAWWAAFYGSHRVGHDWSDLAGIIISLEITYKCKGACTQAICKLWHHSGSWTWASSDFDICWVPGTNPQILRKDKF